MNQYITPGSIIAGIIFGMIAGYLAYKRKRNPYLWFFIGLFFGMIGIFALFFAPLKKKARRKRVTAKRKEPPVPILQGPMDKFWFYLDPTHNQVGPISYHAIAKALHLGEISKTTYVWHENLSDWKKVEELMSGVQKIHT